MGVLGMSSGTISALGRPTRLLCGCRTTTLFVLVLVLNCIRVPRPELSGVPGLLARLMVGPL